MAGRRDDRKSNKSSDGRDRLMIALHAQLKAEQETREALEFVIRQGGLGPELLEALSGKPMPELSDDHRETLLIENVIRLDDRRNTR